MARIRALGAVANAFQQMGTALYSPPPNEIPGIDIAQFPSPSQPIAPIAPPGAAPLGWQIQSGQNLTYTPRADAAYSAATLRTISQYPLARICIENVKDQLSRIPWQIQFRPKAGELTADRLKRSRGDKMVSWLTSKFERPNPDMDYQEFVRRIVDDMLVIDAASVYKQRQKGGDKQIVFMRPLPGDQITRWVDQWGFTPQPPYPAYAQLWEGIPRVNLTTNQLSYRPRNIVPRNTYASHLYGFSPTEQLFDEILVGAMRLRYVLNFYQTGSVPGIVHVIPPNADKDKIKETMQWMNSELAGQLERRRQWRMIQGFNDKGSDQILVLKDPVLADVFDDLHIRKICFGFGTSPQRLQRMMNRASAQSSQEASEEEGMEPWKVWLKSVFDELIQLPNGYNLPDYEIDLQSGMETDLTKQAQIDKILISCGRATMNERRVAAGDDPSPNQYADRLGVITGNGFVPIEDTPFAGGVGGGGSGTPSSPVSPKNRTTTSSTTTRSPRTSAPPKGNSSNKVTVNGNNHTESSLAILDDQDLWESQDLWKVEEGQGYIAVDLDGTLAQYEGDHTTIGAPIEPMVERVKQWLDDGETVKILTARVSGDTYGEQRHKIEEWCLAIFGTILPITNVKDSNMIELWDDRAVRVKRNEGTPLSEHEKTAYKPSSAYKQLMVERSEQLLSEVLGIPRMGEGALFDMQNNVCAIEVKTLIDNSTTITKHKASMERQVKFAKSQNLRTCTIVVDRSGDLPAFYFAEGVGSFTIANMKPVTVDELKTLVKPV